MRVPYSLSLLFLSSIIMHACTQPLNDNRAYISDTVERNNSGFKSFTRDFGDPTPEKPVVDSIPSWVRKIYSKDTTIMLDDEHVQDKIREEVDRFVLVNDSLTYCIVKVYTYTCGRKFLATQLNGKEIQRIHVEESCDADGSLGYYDWTTFTIIGQNKFRTCEYHTYAADSLLKDGWIIDDNKELDDLNPKTDSSVVTYTIDPAGRVVKMN